MKKTKKNLLELEKNLFKPKKHYDYDDTKYEGIRDVRNLFNLSIDKNSCQPIKTVSNFDNENNYIEYESNGDKDKTSKKNYRIS